MPDEPTDHAGDAVASPRAKDEEPPASASRSSPPLRKLRHAGSSEARVVATALVEEAMERLQGRIADAISSAVSLTLREVEQSIGRQELVAAAHMAKLPRHRARRRHHAVALADAATHSSTPVQASQTPLPEQPISPAQPASQASQPAPPSEPQPAQPAQPTEPTQPSQPAPPSKPQVDDAHASAPDASAPHSSSFSQSFTKRNCGKAALHTLAAASHDAYRQPPTEARRLEPPADQQSSRSAKATGAGPAVHTDPTAVFTAAGVRPGARPDVRPVLRRSASSLGSKVSFSLSEPVGHGSERSIASEGVGAHGRSHAASGGGPQRRLSLSASKALTQLVGSSGADAHDQAKAMLQAQLRQAQLRQNGHDPELMKALFGSEAQSLLWKDEVRRMRRATWLAAPLTAAPLTAAPLTAAPLTAQLPCPCPCTHAHGTCTWHMHMHRSRPSRRAT